MCFSGFIFHSSSRAWLALALASRLPPFDRKTLKNCACSADPGLLNETKCSWFPLSCFFLYMRVFHFVIKKKEKGPETGFLWWFWHIFKYFNSNHNLPSYSLFSKCFSWFSYLGVHRGTSVFSWVFLFFTLPLARVLLSRLRRACLRSTEKRWKIAPVLQIQASSMKLRVHGFLFLFFLLNKTDGKNKLFL